MEEPWTILELAELAADALAAPGPSRMNGRVRDVPNERLVRWYVTVGLVDPPLSRRGRVARYGRRHLLQLVAVKRRQAEGRSLAEIQAELAGATDEKLAAVARVPDTRPAPEAPVAAPERFWARQPGPADLVPADPGTGDPGTGDLVPADPGPGDLVPADPGTGDPGPGDLVPADPGTGDPGPGDPGPGDPGGGIPPGGLVHGVRLAPGVTLLLEDAGRGPGPDDVTEILNAARPLLEELARRSLCADHLEE